MTLSDTTPAEPTDDDPMTPLEAGIVTLTADDLKQIRNTVISAITHSPDVQAFLVQTVRAALDAAGVLTTGNLATQVKGPLDQWARDRAYEADTEAERHEAPDTEPERSA